MTEADHYRPPIEEDEGQYTYRCRVCNNTKRMHHVWCYLKCDRCGGIMLLDRKMVLLGDPAEN